MKHSPVDFSALNGLDRLIHEPARLGLVITLSLVEEADFLYLETISGLTRGNLSSHLSKLEEGGYVQIEKGYAGKKPRTLCRLTEAGRAALEGYRESLRGLLGEA